MLRNLPRALFRENLNILLIPESGEDVAAFRVRRGVLWSVVSATIIVILLLVASIRLLVEASDLGVTASAAMLRPVADGVTPAEASPTCAGSSDSVIFYPPETNAAPAVSEEEALASEPTGEDEEPALLVSFGPTDRSAEEATRMAPAPAGQVFRNASMAIEESDEPVLRFVDSRQRRKLASASSPLELAPVPVPGARGIDAVTRRHEDRLLTGGVSSRIKRVSRPLTGVSSPLDFVPTGSPLDGQGSYVSGFGYRRDPFTGRRTFHAGLDISSPAGTPIYATAEGVVIHSGPDGFLGRSVRIDHGNGIVTVYAHNSENLVEVGDYVRRGDLIARVGSTGRATGPHVHYGILVDHEHVNPLSFLESEEVAD